MPSSISIHDSRYKHSTLGGVSLGMTCPKSSPLPDAKVNLVSEPRAVATGSSIACQFRSKVRVDPVATARGSETPCGAACLVGLRQCLNSI